MRPLAIYIHWPFCKSKCPYCDFNSHVRDTVAYDRWEQALLRELEYFYDYTKDYKVTSLFFGGGTPSLMPARTVAALIDRTQALWSVAEHVEMTLEANPTSVEIKKFQDFRAAGITRVSLGVQSLDAEALQFLGRGHTASEALKAVELARDIFPRYSFDLIYARPGQTMAGWERELTQAIAYIRDHISLYQLTIEENTAFYHAYAKGGFAMPSEEESEALYRLTEALLAAEGLTAYEVSNYARPGAESHHNMSYWLGNDYIGIGPGAHGRITVNNRRHATQMLKSPERWLEKVEKHGNGLEVFEPVESDVEAQERLMMGLRLQQGIGYDDFRMRHGFDLRDYLNVAKRDLYIAQGLLTNDTARLQTTLSGRLVLNQLTAELIK